MEENEKRLIDYVYTFWKRKYYFLIPFLLVLLIGLPVVFLLPAKYESTATILIETQQIPPDLIRSTITSYADERIEVIKQKILVNAKVSEIIDKYNLYQEEKEKLSKSALTNLFRKNVNIELISANTGRNQATIAFNLSFSDKNAKTSQIITNELVTLFLAENVKTRTQRAEETTEFLAQEAVKIKQSMREIENNLAEFKTKNRDSLPELFHMNTSLMERLEATYQNNVGKIDALKSKISFLESELRLLTSTINNDGVVISNVSATKIVALEEYLSQLKSTYSDKHPSVIRVQAQLDQLKNSGNNSDDPQLIQLQNEYNNMLGKYSKNHPSVVKKKKELDDLKHAIKKSGRQNVTRKSASSPQAIQVSAEINASRSELKSLMRSMAEVEKKLAETENRLLKSPEVEQVYKDLLRDYDNMQSKYQEIKNKELEARIAQNLESEKKGERFSLLEPAIYPEKPTKPNRPKLYTMVAGLAGILGLGMVLLLETLNPVVRGEREIKHIMGDLPLVVIPYIETDEDLNKKKTRLIVIFLILTGLIILGLFILHTFVMPLDVLWFSLLNKLGDLK